MLTENQREMIYKIAGQFLNWQKKHIGNVTTLAFVTDDGVLHVCSNTACHAGLSWPRSYIKSNGKIMAIISGVQGGKENFRKEDRLMFYDWMINESPYKICFLNKDAEEVEEKFWIMNPEAPRNLLASAAFATRHMTEWPAYFESFLEMVSQGVPKNKAFFFSYYLRKKNNGWVVNDRDGGWHQPFSMSRGPDYYKNFINGTPVSAGVSYNQSPGYSNVSAIWGSCRGVHATDFKKIKPIDAQKVDLTRLNIFWKPTMQREVNAIFTSNQLPNFVEQAEKFYAA